MAGFKTVVLTGGGSGGHITPIIAVAHELKRLDPNIRTVYIGKRGDKLGTMAREHDAIDQTYLIFAGKFRRYHTEGWRQLLDVKTVFLNLRDLSYLGIGFIQSLFLLARLKPWVIFIKGGFVGVPVGMAAALQKRPFVTHDSDSIPGLANRIVGRWARAHATGMPANFYPYPPEKTVYTGVPVQAGFQPVTSKERASFRHDLELPIDGRVLFVTGGGLGAVRLNNYIADLAPRLLTTYQDLTILHAAGHTGYGDLLAGYAQLDTSLRSRIIVKDFITNLHTYSGAADVVVMRAGASAFAEMAVQGKPCILVPNAYLTGGHQSKNADAYAREDAASVVTEVEIEQQGTTMLYQAITVLFDDTAERNKLALNIAKFAVPDAAERLAKLLIQIGGGK